MAKIHNLMLSFFFFFNNVALKAKSTIVEAHNKESINQSINQSIIQLRKAKTKRDFPSCHFNISQALQLV